jgi:hypothetical protein
MKKWALMGILCLAVTAQSAYGAGVMWGNASPGWGQPDPKIFKIDTGSGQIVPGTTWTYGEWNWIMDVADSGEYLYAAHNTVAQGYDVAIAKIDRATGNILSDTYVSGFLNQTASQINALEFLDGQLYGIENATWGSDMRGHAVVIDLDTSGDPVSASKGAYLGLAPDGALDYRDGSFYASTWKSGGNPGVSSIGTIDASEIADPTKSFALISETNPASGLMSGWQYGPNGDLISVSWQNLGLYKVDPSTGDTTFINDVSGLPSGYSMGGLDTVVPEPLTMLAVFGGCGALGGYIRRRRTA